MRIEEVSLVDKAANKKRFAFAKSETQVPAPVVAAPAPTPAPEAAPPAPEVKKENPPAPVTPAPVVDRELSPEEEDALAKLVESTSNLASAFID